MKLNEMLVPTPGRGCRNVQQKINSFEEFRKSRFLS